jgi:hypothetical protein
VIGAIEGAHSFVAFDPARLLINVHVIVELEVINALAIGKGEAFACYCGGGTE